MSGQLWYRSCLVAISSLVGLGCSDANPNLRRKENDDSTNLYVLKASQDHHSSIPELEFPSGTVADLGVGWEHANLDHRFQIKNVGEKTVRFRDGVTTSCGCTSGRLSVIELLPGETATLDLTVNVAPEAGLKKRYRATVHQQLVDGGRRDWHFEVIVESRGAWKIVPDSSTIRVATDADKEIEFIVSGSHGRDLSLVDVTTNIPNAKAKYSDSPISSRKDLIVTLQVPRDTPEGHYRVFFNSNDPLVPQKAAHVAVITAAVVRVVPNRVLVTGRSNAFSGRVSVFHPAKSVVTLEDAERFSGNVGAPEPFDADTQRTVVTFQISPNRVADRGDALQFVIEHSDGTRSPIAVDIRFQ
jgi:hypothetical protein